LTRRWRFDQRATGQSNDRPGHPTYRGRLKLNGSTIRVWDSGSFQDSDGTGYVITHNGNIYRLAADYLSAVRPIRTH
jgi:hypothetical protein